MRKTVFALTAVILICLLEPMTQVLIVNANGIPAPAVAISSPRPYFVKIYQNTTIPLIISVRILRDSPDIACVRYSLDGKANVTLTDFKKGDLMAFSVGAEGYVLSTESTLVNLEEGNHTLKAYAFYDDVHYAVMSTSEVFTVDTTYRYPTVTIISPLNQTYDKNKVQLIYDADGEIQRAYYTLDYFGNNSFNGNITLTGLSEGPHRILVSVRTERGYASQMTYFSVNTTQTDTAISLAPSIMPNLTSQSIASGYWLNPIYLVAIVSIVVTLAITSLSLVYFNRHKKKN